MKQQPCLITIVLFLTFKKHIQPFIKYETVEPCEMVTSYGMMSVTM